MYDLNRLFRSNSLEMLCPWKCSTAAPLPLVYNKMLGHVKLWILSLGIVVNFVKVSIFCYRCTCTIESIWTCQRCHNFRCVIDQCSCCIKGSTHMRLLHLGVFWVFWVLWWSELVKSWLLTGHVLYMPLTWSLVYLLIVDWMKHNTLALL